MAQVVSAWRRSVSGLGWLVIAGSQVSRSTRWSVSWTRRWAGVDLLCQLGQLVGHAGVVAGLL